MKSGVLFCGETHNAMAVPCLAFFRLERFGAKNFVNEE
jgi:hypothetical protein